MPFTEALLKKFWTRCTVHRTILALAVVLGPFAATVGMQWEYAMASDLEQRAVGGNLEAQRELADCLTKGCTGVQANRALACAWRIVIVAGGMPGIAAADVEHRRLACGNLAPNERREAEAQARSLLKQVYGRDLVLPADFFEGPARAK